MSLPTSLRVDFKPSTVRPNEQSGITTICTTAWQRTQALRPSRSATVYSYVDSSTSTSDFVGHHAWLDSSSGGAWWHTNDNDRREHITVRYDSRPQSRVHIYRNGEVNLRPDRPKVAARALNLSAESYAAGEAEGEEGYDTVPELSDEEWSEGDEL